ncbi:MAG: hypothetical protein ACREXS_19885 [Gammaproteobacteria bacterium]
MNRPNAILVCDHDPLFRTALQNFLLAAGYSSVEVAVTIRVALSLLCRNVYGHILIGVSRTFVRERRLAAVARRRQPKARILFLASGDDRLMMKNAPFEWVLKEQAFSTLLALMQHH